MPESKGRGVPKPQARKEPGAKEVNDASPRWLAPTMVTLFVVGLVWIVLYYLVPDMPGLSTLGNWNLLVGFGLILGGFTLSTRWR